MRLLAGVLLMVVTSASAIAQSPNWVEIRQGRSRAGVAAVRTEPYAGGPWAAIPSTPLRAGTPVTANDFRVRTWLEAGKTRVVVFAVRRETRDNRETETQIATFLLTLDESRDVIETEQFGAAHVFVSLEAR